MRTVRARRSATASPLLLKGPTGCGKTRFVAHMAARLGAAARHRRLPRRPDRRRPHRPLSLHGDETIWTDGPLTRAVRHGGICYLDEVVEARKDVTVVLHPLTDDRRILPLDRTGETLDAPRRFHAGGLLQPRLPVGAEDAEADDAPALRRARLSTTLARRRSSRIVAAESGLPAQTRCRPLVLLAASAARAWRRRSGGGLLDAPPRLCGDADRRRHAHGRRGARGDDRAVDRRSPKRDAGSWNSPR